MKKLIIALLLCLVPFSAHAEEDFSEELAHVIAKKMLESRQMSLCEYTFNVSTKKQYAACFSSCVNTAYNGKLLNKNFCQFICEEAKNYESKIAFRLVMTHEKTNHIYWKSDFDLFKQHVKKAMVHFNDPFDDNITVTESSYVDPIQPTCGETCVANLKKALNVVAAVFIPGYQYNIVSAVINLM